jgi:bifunctional non-homologous end joining protein LigD
MGQHTTVDFPVDLPVEKRGEHWYARAGDRVLKLSNLNKVFWPREGFTKADLLTYYFNISPVMLPHLEERPLTLKRMPDGVGGAYFYEKNAPPHAPDWIHRMPVESSEEPGKITNHMAVCDVAEMLWVVNLGCVEFHPLHAKGGDQERPSYAFFDLDPMHGATWEDVREVAGLVHTMLEQLGVPSYPKTSGATGMQIYIPLSPPVTYDEVRGFVGTLSDVVHEMAPELTTVEWEVAKRGKSVFLDVNMNRKGANIAAVYSVRPEPGATVSTPFSWDELGEMRPRDWTVETIFERVAELGDPFQPVATGPGADIRPLMEQLGAKPRKARLVPRRPKPPAD